jgi:hypothetical protein
VQLTVHHNHGNANNNSVRPDISHRRPSGTGGGVEPGGGTIEAGRGGNGCGPPDDETGRVTCPGTVAGKPRGSMGRGRLSLLWAPFILPSVGRHHRRIQSIARCCNRPVDLGRVSSRYAVRRGITRGTKRRILMGNLPHTAGGRVPKTVVESLWDGVVPTRNEKVGSRSAWLTGQRLPAQCDPQPNARYMLPTDSRPSEKPDGQLGANQRTHMPN